MSELTARYLELIDAIADLTLQGKIRSAEQVYRMLLDGVETGTGEIFERALSQRLAETEAQLETKLKATRILRALQTIAKQWTRWQQENQAREAIASLSVEILKVESGQYFQALIEAIDLNRDRSLNREQLIKLAQALKSAAPNQTETQAAQDLEQLAAGITAGLKSFTALEGDLVSWIYDSGSRFAGFGAEAPNPWRTWAQKVSSPLPKQLFQTLAQHQEITDFTKAASQAELAAWVELAILLQYLQRGLVSWFDRQPYNAKFGKQLSYSTFLSFAIIWCELWRNLVSQYPTLATGCWLMMLQILRAFARRDDFPLYSGVFADFSGEYLQNTLEYFDEPLRQVEGTAEKARILTLLGYSQGALGEYDKAIAFQQSALAIAIEAADRPCEIANLNHISRIYVNQKQYDDGINLAQRALIMARQVGDKLGEANALVNLGYAQVLAARQLDTIEADAYTEAIRYLEQGIELAKKQGDFQSQACGYSSLGIAYVILAQPTTAINALTKGAELAQYSRDVYLQGLSWVYLAEAYYTIEDVTAAICFGSLGMYLLKQINSREWRQPAGLLSIIQGQIGTEKFSDLLAQKRRQIIALIGVDGYDYLPTVLAQYKSE